MLIHDGVDNDVRAAAMANHAVHTTFDLAMPPSPEQESLKQLLLRLAVDHPYHSLYHLFALANGNRDRHGRKIQRGQVPPLLSH